MAPDAPTEAPRVLVLGGSGFIGRHAVAALQARGATPVVGTRRPSRLQRRLGPLARGCPAREVHIERLLRPEGWVDALAGVEVVVNCVGILRERGSETYERVHHLAPAALAAACRRAGVRLVHVSALGLEGRCRSGFLRSKQRGETALKASGVGGCIVRPSLLDAPAGGYGAAWIRRVARWPWLALPEDARGRIAALDVRDLAEALATLALAAAELRTTVARGVRAEVGAEVDTSAPTFAEYEFGGPTPEPLRDHIARLRRGYGLPAARVVALPAWLARAGAHACDLLHVTPFSFGHWELLRRDNCPAVNDLPRILGRMPRELGPDAGAVPVLRPGALPA